MVASPLTSAQSRSSLMIQLLWPYHVFGSDLVYDGIAVNFLLGKDMPDSDEQLVSVGHDYLLTSLFQNLTCPTWMITHFHNNLRWLKDVELPVEAVSGSGNTTFFNHIGGLIQDENFLNHITEINSNKKCAIVRHGPVPPFVPMSALIFGNILHKMEPVFEGPAFSY